MKLMVKILRFVFSLLANPQSPASQLMSNAMGGMRSVYAGDQSGSFQQAMQGMAWSSGLVIKSIDDHFCNFEVYVQGRGYLISYSQDQTLVGQSLRRFDPVPREVEEFVNELNHGSRLIRTFIVQGMVHIGSPYPFDDTLPAAIRRRAEAMFALDQKLDSSGY